MNTQRSLQLARPVALRFEHAMGALAQLAELRLYDNKIGDDGMKALADAVSMGALGNLVVLHLLKNQITDDGFVTLMPFLKKGGKLSNLTTFSIGSGITDKGMTEFADILSNGALASLEKLYVDDTEHPALKDACEALGIELL